MYAYYMEILFLPGKKQLGSCQTFALNFPNKKMGESKQRVESWKWSSKCGTTQSLPQWNIHIHGGTLADLHRKCDTFQRWELVQQQGQHTLAMQKHLMLQLLTLGNWVVCCPGQPSWISFKTWPLPGFQHLFFWGGGVVEWGVSESGAPNLVSRTFDCQHMAIFPFLTGQAARSAGCRPVGQASQVYNYPIPSMLKRRNGQNVNMSSIITSRKKKTRLVTFLAKSHPHLPPTPPKNEPSFFFQNAIYFHHKTPPSSCVVAGQVWSGTLRGSTRALKSPLPNSDCKNGPNLLPTRTAKIHQTLYFTGGLGEIPHFTRFHGCRIKHWFKKRKQCTPKIDSRIFSILEMDKNRRWKGGPKVTDDLVLIFFTGRWSIGPKFM